MSGHDTKLKGLSPADHALATEMLLECQSVQDRVKAFSEIRTGPSCCHLSYRVRVRVMAIALVIVIVIVIIVIVIVIISHHLSLSLIISHIRSSTDFSLVILLLSVLAARYFISRPFHRYTVGDSCLLNHDSCLMTGMIGWQRFGI